MTRSEDFVAWAPPPGWDANPRPVADAEGLAYPRLDRESTASLCRHLRRSRERGTAGRPVRELVRALGAVGGRFLDVGDPWREEALARLPADSGLSKPMARVVLEGMARDWTASRLSALLASEFGDPAVLDAFRAAPVRTAPVREGSGKTAVRDAEAVPEQEARAGGAGGTESGGKVRAVGPELSVHVCAGTVPGVSVTSMIRALLVKSAVVIKPGRGDAVLPVLFARALQEEDPAMAEAVAVLYWPGGEGEGEAAFLDEADAVVAYGSDRTIESLRARLPRTTRFVGYGHRLGVGMVGREGLSAPGRAGRIAAAAALSVATFDRRGCVSPQLLFVERGGACTPEAWAERLADALANLEPKLPAGPLAPAEASELQQVRGTAELRAAAGEPVWIRHGGAASWTVVLDPDGASSPSCPGRVVRVVPVRDLGDAVETLSGLREHLQTVSVDGVGDRVEPLAESLARIGASRITTASRAPWPPAWWRHDGSGPLRVLTRWVDLEEDLPGDPPSAD